MKKRSWNDRGDRWREPLGDVSGICEAEEDGLVGGTTWIWREGGENDRNALFLEQEC